MPVTGGNPKRVDTKLIGPANPVFSGDGKYLAFTSWADGKQSIFRIPVAGGPSERLTEYFASEPAYSPDGSLIACYFLKGDDEFFSLGIIPADGGLPVMTFEIPPPSFGSIAPVWSPDGKQITYVVAAALKADLWAQSVDGGEPVRLSEFSRPWMGRQAYSRDGKRIAVTRGERITDVVMLRGLE